MRVLVVVLTGWVLSACKSPPPQEVTDWFRLQETPSPAVRSMLEGPGTGMQVASIRIGGRWQEVARGVRGLTLQRVGSGVAVWPAYQIGDTPEHFQIFRDGVSEPVVLSQDRCPHAIVRRDVPTVVCFGCGAAPPLQHLNGLSGECSAVTASEHSLEGRVLWSRTVKMAEIPTGCQEPRIASLLTTAGEPVVNIPCELDGSEWEQRLFAMRPHGFERVGLFEHLIEPAGYWSP